MHLQRLVAASVVVLCSSGVRVASAEDVVFDGRPMEFAKVGPIEASPGDKVKLVVRDGDPRRRWSLQLDYTEPVADRAKLDAAIVGKLLAGGGGTKTIASFDEKAAPRPAEMAKALKGNAEALAGSVAAFLKAQRASDAALDKVKAEKVIVERARDALANPKLTVPAADKTEVDEALSAATGVLAVAADVIAWCEESRSAHEFPFTVHSGFRRVTLRACYQQLELGSDNASVIARDPVCSRGYYDIPVQEPASGPRIIAGALIPIYAKQPREFFLDAANGDALTMSKKSAPTGDPQPALFVGARKQLKRSNWGIAPELGFAVGDRLGELYSLGVALDYWGVGVGLGVALDTKGTREAIPGATTGSASDRTRTGSLVSWYLRIGLSSELWEAFSRSSEGGGPTNVAQKPPEPTNSNGQPAPETKP